MAILKWGSSRRILFVHETMGKLFEDAVSSLRRGRLYPSPWLPPCDIYETGDRYVLKAEAPGVELGDIVLEVSGNVVSFAGERKRERDVGAENYHMVERSSGRFMRSFTLPDSVEEEDVAASLKDGVLTVTMKKKPASQKSGTVEIKVK